MDNFIFKNNDFNINNFALLFLVAILVIASIIDFRFQKIPNLLTFFSALAGFVYHFSASGIQGIVFSLTGIIIGIAVLIIPYAMGGMGAGDVKLMGAVGAFLGAKGVFVAFLFTAFFGGIYALFIILYFRDIFKGFFKQLFQTFLSFILTKKYFPDPVVEHTDKPRLCYGIAIALGSFTYILIQFQGNQL